MNLTNTKDTHIVLIGAGIMSATLAVLLRRLNPHIKISIYEKLASISAESSAALNNAGTGHSGFCELNYTPQTEHGDINIEKAISVANAFEISKEFWSYLVEDSYFTEPEMVIRSTPHYSFVWGDDDVNFLKNRWKKMKEHPLFETMEFSTDFETLTKWMPLVMKDRDLSQKVAATRMKMGTDVNFGELARRLILPMVMKGEIQLHVAHEVKDLNRIAEKWELRVKDLTTGKSTDVLGDFVFIGAGGGALPLLDKSGIEEGDGFGGFPVAGEWLICNNQNLISQHHGKVYGKAKVGAPPMSVPHLDSRQIGNQKALLFGPFAEFSTKFLKNGSIWDLPLSIEWSNLKPMLAAGLNNLPLTHYLIQQVSQDKDDKINALKEYFPDAIAADWDEQQAGQRVQIIKKDKKEGGVLEFGTEIVNANDGSIAALLGASPGASTAVHIMLDLLEKCFPENLNEWEPTLRLMIPSYKNTNLDRKYFQQSRERTNRLLKLDVD